ncbi:hypothetical protein FCI23_12880 [Actinacidiphila oryziradicis]|uniref:Uncharacterized protein n=1 Tax=Actinacidiphila oryziradicis TaxID=2571141 RepID=A0A4V5N0A1_9ACTN|nr:hypothetical protein FCI23_12880 [Actinacidiphila oryziradicis]
MSRDDLGVVTAPRLLILIAAALLIPLVDVATRLEIPYASELFASAPGEGFLATKVLLPLKSRRAR